MLSFSAKGGAKEGLYQLGSSVRMPAPRLLLLLGHVEDLLFLEAAEVVEVFFKFLDLLLDRVHRVVPLALPLPCAL